MVKKNKKMKQLIQRNPEIPQSEPKIDEKINDCNYDDIVIANMRVDGIPSGISGIFRKNKKKNDLNLTGKEKTKIIFGAYLAYLPMFIALIVGFFLVYAFIRFVWLG